MVTETVTSKASPLIVSVQGLPSINTLVSAHVSATVPNFYVQELDVDDAPWRDDIMTHPLEIVDGHLLLNNRPGLGADLIEEEMAKRPVRDRYPYR